MADPGARTPQAPFIRPAAHIMRLGFVPLFDAAPLLVAEALGLFETVGLRVALSAEASWASIRDKLAFSALDGAHLLSPMPIALAAGLGGVEARLQVACGLSRNGNGITLCHQLAGGDLASKLKARTAKATLAVVFPFSSHNYLLRSWLLAQGVDPERDVRLTALPPSRMAARLAEGEIQGFCAGAPWGAAAEAAGSGRVVAGTADIWPGHPEKLLAFRAAYLGTQREQAIAATAAIVAAARWLDAPENRAQAISIMAARALWQVSPATIESAFDATHRISFGAATLPRREEAALWLAAMRAAGHMPDTIADAQALSPFSDELWRDAATRINKPTSVQEIQA